MALVGCSLLSSPSAAPVRDGRARLATTPLPNWIARCCEYNRDYRCRLLCCNNRRRVMRVVAIPPVQFAQALHRCGGPFALRRGRAGAHESHRPLRRLLGIYSERPCRRTSNNFDELAPLHSLISSARPIRVLGTLRPSAFAALRVDPVPYQLTLIGAAAKAFLAANQYRHLPCGFRRYRPRKFEDMSRVHR